ncbi:MAG TPA: restriction endonuclease subunit R, partial [Anaerolineae bacterium]|nr:restriction endonuclease subunit R [Anaerolineae bacterium]
MAHTLAEAQDEVAELVQQYRTNLNAYRAPGYKEAHARQHLIDPLLMALGWDVHNLAHAAPHRCEVIHEASLDIEGARKAPDYAFRFGAETVFYVEAKKPGVSIKTAGDAAFQLRRYAWSAKLPLSLLTDFEELAVYDCRLRPADTDKASIARINYYTYDQYPDLWREVWAVFSREAVYAGSFDQYAQTSKGKRGTTPVDAEFLKEIEGWREVLARNLALRNAALSIDELNDAVQRTIDRIIFLRMAEDRGIEPYARLQELAAQDDIYAGLLDLCRQADAKYNSGLFDFSAKGDRLTPKLSLDDK